METKQDKDINIPNRWVLFMLETKSGVMEVAKYNRKAIKVTILGESTV